MKKLFKRNEGYSLVELIICLAIIAVLSGVATLTISVISNGRVTATKDTFDSEVGALITRTKTQSADNAIQLVRDDNSYVVYYGTSTNGTDFTANDAANPDKYLNKCDIYYSENGSAPTLVSESGVMLQFDKTDGSCISGYGTYYFCKNGKAYGDYLAKMTISKTTGSHYSGE